MGSWIDLFATTYKVSDDADVKHRATTLLRDKFSMGAISICLQIYTDSMSGMEVKIYETHAIPVEEMAKCREIERLHFDTLVQTHPELAFMTSGCAGRIKYQIIPSVNEEHSHIQFNELERAPILDLNQRRFRQSFPLSADYQLHSPCDHLCSASDDPQRVTPPLHPPPPPDHPCSHECPLSNYWPLHTVLAHSSTPQRVFVFGSEYLV